jgi:putative restriction endonuclease
MTEANPQLQSLARQTGRSAASIELKMRNFASLDLSERARGVTGMKNVSALDRAVWTEMAECWDDLAHATAGTEIDDKGTPHQTERRTEVTQRIGQAFFRRAVLAAWDNSCAITGLRVADLLRASHIVPWADDESNRLNPRNGLCLNALHDAAFDRGLMTIDESMRVVYARSLRSALKRADGPSMVAAYEGQALRSPERLRPEGAFLEHHRTRVFVDA